MINTHAVHPWKILATATAKSLQSCPTLCDPIDGSPPGSAVPGILPARTLEWVAISFSNAWTWKVKVKSLSCVQLLVTPWTAAYQASPSLGFSRQEDWSGVPLRKSTLKSKGNHSATSWDPVWSNTFLKFIWTYLTCPIDCGLRFQHTNMNSSQHQTKLG